MLPSPNLANSGFTRLHGFRVLYPPSFRYICGKSLKAKANPPPPAYPKIPFGREETKEKKKKKKHLVSPRLLAKVLVTLSITVRAGTTRAAALLLVVTMTMTMTMAMAVSLLFLVLLLLLALPLERIGTHSSGHSSKSRPDESAAELIA
jgi:hypothetical protein